MLQASACRDTARKVGATDRKQETEKRVQILFSFKSTNDLHLNLGTGAPESPSIITIMCLKECLLPANFFKNMIWVILSELIGIILKLLLGRMPEK